MVAITVERARGFLWSLIGNSGGTMKDHPTGCRCIFCVGWPRWMTTADRESAVRLMRRQYGDEVLPWLPAITCTEKRRPLRLQKSDRKPGSAGRGKRQHRRLP